MTSTNLRLIAGQGLLRGIEGGLSTRARLALAAAAALWCLAFVTRAWWPLRLALMALLLEVNRIDVQHFTWRCLFLLASAAACSYDIHMAMTRKQMSAREPRMHCQAVHT